MNVAIILNDNSYPGREYLSAIISHGLKIDAVVIGSFSEFDNEEDERCGGLWSPPQQDSLFRDLSVYRFSSLNDGALLRFLRERKYDFGIQGGTGILKAPIIDSFRYGILNFHPGKLPEYRGCSAPEWQLLEGKDVVCTCHLIDDGIDSGKVYRYKVLFDRGVRDYYKMRAGIYPRISNFVVEILKELDEEFPNRCFEQDESKAIYRKYIGNDLIEKLKIKMKE